MSNLRLLDPAFGDNFETAIRCFSSSTVVGTHGRRGLSRVLLGSGAESVIRLATIPVLVIRSDEDGPTP